MTYNYSKLSFDHFDYMGGATSFYPSPVRERKRKREEKDPPNCIPAKKFSLCLKKQSKHKEVAKVLNHILSRGKVQTAFQCSNSNLWLVEKVVIENHCNCGILNSACKKAIPSNLAEGNPEEVHSESREGKKSIANPSCDEKVPQKVDNSTKVLYPEHERGENEDCEVGEIVSKTTHQRRSRRNQLKKRLTGFCNAVKKAMTKQLHKLSCFN